MKEPVAEVIDNCVAHVRRAVGDCRAAARVVGEQGMVDRDPAALRPVDQAVVVHTLGMPLGVGFLDGAPLESDILGTVNIHGFIAGPGAGNVVENTSAHAGKLDRVRPAHPWYRVRPDSQEADHDIRVSGQAFRVIGRVEHAFDRDSGSWCGLPHDRDLAVIDRQFPGNHSAGVENHDPGPLGAAGLLKAARAVGVQIGHLEHPAAPATRSGAAEPLGSWKSRQGICPALGFQLGSCQSGEKHHDC
ncbi:MAG: hypothetical protein JRK26_06330 [Deltaproteobacteria bacterium]|nr:hypothetical protein [Deltaproteobacteria bacterium]